MGELPRDDFSPDQIRMRMKMVRATLDQDISNVVTDARALARSLNVFGNHPWWCLGAVVIAGYFAVPSKKQFLKLDPEQLRRLSKEHTVVIAEPGAQATRGGGLTSAISSALVRAALVLASRNLSHIVDRLANHSRPGSVKSGSNGSKANGRE